MKKIHCGMERFVRAALGAYIDVKCPAESILSKTGTHRLTAPHTRLAPSQALERAQYTVFS